MTDRYIFLPLEHVLYGAGSVAELPAELARLGARRAFIITGRTVAEETPLVNRLKELLGDQVAGVFAGIQQHVPESGVSAAAAAARDGGTDLLISLGGGSAIDGAKGVAYALAGDNGRPLPHIAIPTTLSAAEYSHTAGYTIEDTRTKSRVADTGLTPRVIILDPEMTLHTPIWLWSSSGIRALDHAVETLYAPGYHPVQDALALEAIRELFTYLPLAREKPDDPDVRLHGQLAAWMSLFSPASIQYGLSHILSKSFGTTYGVPHGITSCITLPPVMRYKATTHSEPLARMARTLGVAGPETPDREAALHAADAVADLIRRLELPHRLRDVDVPRDALDQIATTAVGDSRHRTDVLRILEQAW